MNGRKVGIAAGSQLGAEAAIDVARVGGNAVDACLASAIMGWVAEPFFASMGGSGFIAVHPSHGDVEIIDGNTTMTGTPAELGAGIERIYFSEYADGMYTGVGGGSVGVPGILAAVRTTWERHGAIEWAALFEPAARACREGFPFPKTSAYYLSVTWEPLWSRFEEARAVFSIDARPIAQGERFVQPQLAEVLELVADRGPNVFYGGELGKDLIALLDKTGGHMTLDDLSDYDAEVRHPLTADAFGWRIDTNPPPAVGGVTMMHMLALLAGGDLTDEIERLRIVVEAQRAATAYRRERYFDPGGIAAAYEEAVSRIRTSSADTTHSSAADSDGNVCSITESTGYGSGLLARGILLNNTLGEEELHPLGVHRVLPGQRCLSNMTPTIATGPDRVVGLGSPGADRIVGALVQTLLHITIEGASLHDAVAAARAHLDPRPEGETLCYEPGLPGDALGFKARPYDGLHMYFGAVQAASVDDDGNVDAAHDPRRSGGSAVV